MVRVNILKPAGVEVLSPSDRETSIDIKPTVGIKITQNRLKDYFFEITARESLNGDILIYNNTTYQKTK